MNDIYGDFHKYNEHIVTRAKKDKAEMSADFQDISEYYFNSRLPLLNGSVVVDRRYGAPIPYLEYWFSDAFEYKDEHVIDDFGMALVYISIVNCARDDLIDNDLKFNNDTIVSFSNVFYGKYYNIFERLFPPTSPMWYIIARSLDDWAKCENWNYTYNHNMKDDPFAKPFLENSSRYLVSITLPSIAASAILSDHEHEISNIFKFLQNYWMGWKILDDLKDWKDDLYKKNYNQSSVLYHTLKRTNQQGINLDENSICSFLMDEGFVNEIYDSISGYYIEAKNSISHLKSTYLTEFIDRQLDYNRSQINYYRELSSGLYKAILDLHPN